MNEDEYKAKSKKNLMFSILGIAAIFIGSFILGGVNESAFGSTISTLGGLTVGATIVYEIYIRTKKRSKAKIDIV